MINGLCSRTVKKLFAKGIKKSKKIFYSEYMEKHRPKAPSCICQNALYRHLGITSPSLYLLVAGGYMGEKEASELKEYHRKTERYLCYKRVLDKERWKALYRDCRKEKKQLKAIQEAAGV